MSESKYVPISYNSNRPLLSLLTNPISKSSFISSSSFLNYEKCLSVIASKLWNFNCNDYKPAKALILCIGLLLHGLCKL